VEAIDIQGKAILQAPSDERLGNQRETCLGELQRDFVKGQPLTIHQNVESIELMHRRVRDMLLNGNASANPIDGCPWVPASEVFAVENDTLSGTAVLVEPCNRFVIDMRGVPRCHLADEVCVMIYLFLSGVIQYILGIAGALKREVATIDFFDCDKFPDAFGVATDLVQINLVVDARIFPPIPF
jgi:hypothetical protein